jgi:hypothetical protein
MSSNNTIGNNSTDPPAPKYEYYKETSIAAFTSALLFNIAVGAGIFVAFLFVRHWSKKIYQPRTYLVAKE